MPTLEALRTAAAEQAAGLSADFVGTEHLFLAWLTHARGPILDACSAAGLNPESFVAVLSRSRQGRRRSRPAGGTDQGGLSSHANRVIALATERAVASGREEPTADDLVLAMVQEPRGAIARALTEFDIKPSQLKALAPDRPQSQARKAASVPQEPAAPSEPAAPRPKRRERTPRVESNGPVEPTQPRETRGRQARNREPVAEASSPVAAPRASQPEPSRIRPAARLELGPARKVSLLAPLYLAVPVAIWSHLTAFDVRLTMAMALLGLIPLGALTCTAIRQLTVRSSPGAAHLIIALAGNGAALALIIASALSGQPLLALMITAGSIAANLLLVLGLALMARGTGAGPLRFEPQGSGRGAAAIALAVTALGFPTLQRLISSDAATLPLPQLAQATGGLLLAAFLASIIFVVHGRRHFLGDPDHDAGQLHGAWSVPQATLALLAGLIGMAAMAIIAVYEVPAFSAVMQLSPTFMGMILIPAVASLAQHSGEITAARRGHPELAISSTLSATTALALLAAPVLVGVALITGVASADLVFAPLALIAMAVAAIGAGMITREGEARWFEGFLLLVLYGLLVAGSWLF